MTSRYDSEESSEEEWTYRKAYMETDEQRLQQQQFLEQQRLQQQQQQQLNNQMQLEPAESGTTYAHEWREGAGQSSDAFPSNRGNRFIPTNRYHQRPRGNQFIPEAFFPRDFAQNSGGKLLNLDCVQDDSQLRTIEEWYSNNRIMLITNPVLTTTAERVWEYLQTTLEGDVLRWFNSISAESKQSAIEGNRGSPLEVLTALRNFLQVEFIGIDIIGGLGEAIVSIQYKAEIHLSNMKICDMCYIDNFICEYPTPKTARTPAPIWLNNRK